VRGAPVGSLVSPGFGAQEAAQLGIVAPSIIARPPAEFQKALELFRGQRRQGKCVLGMRRRDAEFFQGRWLAWERYALAALNAHAPPFGGSDLFRSRGDQRFAFGDQPFGGFEPQLVSSTIASVLR
jgi:hypothetical protein